VIIGRECSTWGCLRLFARATLLALLVSTTLLGQTPQTPNPLAPKNKKTPQEAQQPSAAAQPGETHDLTAIDVDAFLAGVLPLQLQRENIAGAVVIVVKDGKVLYSHGYGYADVEKKIPVSPDSTLFRPGSISKLLNWTAVMQLVEQGKLDLDRDVNEYLDFKIPATYPQPITLRNIMTHTGGFEETVQELFVKDAKDLTPLDVYLKAHMPARIFPPGTTPAYSNYATTIAGYIVQRVSGQPFDDYIEEHILKPLGMTQSTTRQPLPDSFKARMSNGYDVASQPAKTFEYVEAAPAGSSSVTAADMAKFMIAHLQDGTYQGVQILKPETAKMMHSRQFENIPGMNGMALGFYEETRNGHRIIGHGGDTQYFHSDLHLVPDANLGFFISYNSAGKGEIDARGAVWHQFLDRYFPYQPPAGAQVANAAQDAQAVSGHYIVSRRSEDTVLKVLTVAGETKVSTNDDGSISVSDLKDLNGEPKKFREIGPLLFRDVNGQDLLGFKHDSSGKWVFAIDFPFMVFQEAPLAENSIWNVPLIIGSLVILLLTVLLWPVAALVRKRYGQKLVLTPQQQRLRLLVRIVCLVDLVFFAAFALFLTLAFKDIGLLSPKYNVWLRLIQIVGWVGIIGTVLALLNAFRSWRQPDRWVLSRIGDTLIALACLGVVWFTFTWNMLHWSLRY
jgi:CubicO group peptidase (beta-lactamase class C family)